ncbi:GLOBIN domain-containing protein [Caerostris extrusa]|uniref:GLOBIN domain-containing protein n=1 Tax=Caerostris extrusa TaxID=172846 RepID=A0AAV4UZG5_CAEEX|nr:GLOBIN domain-containing protein [Caerostris extrusa]
MRNFHYPLHNFKPSGTTFFSVDLESCSKRILTSRTCSCPSRGMSPDELRHSKELRAHGLRVMGFVQKVVARFEEPDKSEVLLKELGKNHVMYGAKMDYVDVSTTAHSLRPPPHSLEMHAPALHWLIERLFGDIAD